MKGAKDRWFWFSLSLYFLLYMLGCWNIFGLNGMQKHKGVNDLINKYKLNIMDLLKTKITSSKIKRVETTINPSLWQFLFNVSDIINWCILIGWDTMVYNVSLMHFSLQLITRKVFNLVEGCFFVVTFVYGLNTSTGRQTL